MQNNWWNFHLAPPLSPSMSCLPPPPGSHDPLQMGWGNQGGDSDMFGMWMEDLGEEQSSDMDDVSLSTLL